MQIERSACENFVALRGLIHKKNGIWEFLQSI